MPPAVASVNPALVPPGQGLKVDDSRKWDRICEAADRFHLKDVETYERFVNLYKDGQFKQEEDSQNVSANRTFAYIGMLMAFLYAQQPSIECEPRDGGGAGQDFAPLLQAGVFKDTDSARKEFADTLEALLTYSYEETGSFDQNKAALFEMLVRGASWTQESFDPERGIDRTDALRRDEVFIDPHARFALSQAGYIVKIGLMQIDAARKFFAAKGVNPSSLEPNYTLSEEPGQAASQVEKDKAQGGDKDQLKFYEIWCKDDNGPYLHYRIHGKKDRAAELWRGPWPFELKHDDWPFVQWALYRQYMKVSDAFPALHVVEPIRKTYENMVSYTKRHTGRALAKKVLMDETIFDDTARAAMLNAQDLVEVKTKPLNGKNWGDVLKVFSVNDGDVASEKLAEWMKTIYDELLGQDELLRGAETNDMTAQEASIRDENSKVRTGFMQRAIDNALSQQSVHRACIARQLVPADVVANISGPLGATLWQMHAGNHEDLLREYSVGVAAGSTGQRMQRERLQRLERLYGKGVDLNKNYGAPVVNLVEIALEEARLDKNRRPERYFNMALVAQLEAPPPPPAPMGAPAMPGQPGVAPAGPPPVQNVQPPQPPMPPVNPAQAVGNV